MFARMAALFRNKAKSEGLIPFANEHHQKAGIFTDTFKLWCVKLKDLGVEDFARGTIAMEQKAEAMYQQGEQMWPPSFAEFRALCFPAVDYDKQALKVWPSQFDPKHAHLFLEDQTAKEKRYELGKQKSAELLGVLGVEPEKPVYSNEFAAAQLEKAKRLLEEKNHG